MHGRRAIATVTATVTLGRGASCLLAMALCVGPTAVLAQELDGIEIGRISDLDLDAFRVIIEQNDFVAMPEPSEVRPLSLEDAVKTALENNLGLQIVAVDVGQSELEIKATRSKFHPVAAVGGDALGTNRNEPDPNLRDQSSDSQQLKAVVRQESPTGGSASLGVGYGREFTDEVVTVIPSATQPYPLVNQQNSSEIAGLGIEIRQPLLRGGRTYVARQKILDAEYDNEARRAELQGRILQVTAETKAAYYATIGAARQVEVIEQAIERDDKLIRASTALFDAGRVSKVDLFSAEISQSNDRARLATAQADLEIAQNALRKVIGLPIDVEIEVTDSTIPFRPIRIELDTWIIRALDTRPELTRLQAQLEKVELAVKVSKNSTLPTLDVSGGFSPGFDWKSYNYSAGLSMEYQIGNVAAESRLSQVRLERDKIRHEIARARRDIDLEVREIEIRLRENVLRLRNLTTSVASARQKGEIARGRFEMGLANNLDITNADEELIRSESLLLQALVDYATNIAQLEARIGGEL
jgi:outer membrane protein TolC